MRQPNTFSVAHVTQRGVNRNLNQDSFLVDVELGLLIVADGMGGHNAGEVASAKAVQKISESIRAEFCSDTDDAALVRESLLAAHRAILESAVRNPAWQDMGTTVVMAFLREDEVWIGHVGDSRAYLITNIRVIPLTQDHTFLAQWLEEGIITPENAKKHPARHGLFMALGVDEEMDPAISRKPWPDGASLLLCSDGLTDTLEDEEILKLIDHSPTLDEACRRLVRSAVEKGAQDDITVVLARRHTALP